MRIRGAGWSLPLPLSWALLEAFDDRWRAGLGLEEPFETLPQKENMTLEVFFPRPAASRNMFLLL